MFLDGLVLSQVEQERRPKQPNKTTIPPSLESFPPVDLQFSLLPLRRGVCAYSMKSKVDIALLLVLILSCISVTASNNKNNHTHPHAHAHASSSAAANTSVPIHSGASLLRAVQMAAGVYKEGTDVSKTQHRRSLNKTVIITGCNHGFLNHLLNFKCFMDRLSMKFLVIAMDLHAYSYITNNTTMISYLMNEGVVGEVTGSSQDFRSKQFNLITQKKKEAVHNVMELGYDVLFADTDVAILKDPFDFLLYDNVDYVHSLNLWCQQTDNWDLKKSKVEGNTGVS